MSGVSANAREVWERVWEKSLRQGRPLKGGGERRAPIGWVGFGSSCDCLLCTTWLEAQDRRTTWVGGPAEGSCSQAAARLLLPAPAAVVQLLLLLPLPPASSQLLQLARLTATGLSLAALLRVLPSGASSSSTLVLMLLLAEWWEGSEAGPPLPPAPLPLACDAADGVAATGGGCASDSTSCSMASIRVGPPPRRAAATRRTRPSAGAASAAAAGQPAGNAVAGALATAAPPPPLRCRSNCSSAAHCSSRNSSQAASAARSSPRLTMRSRGSKGGSGGRLELQAALPLVQPPEAAALPLAARLRWASAEPLEGGGRNGVVERGWSVGSWHDTWHGAIGCRTSGPWQRAKLHQRVREGC